MTSTRHAGIILILLMLLSGAATADLRFPTPELDEPLPETTTPEPRQGIWRHIEYVDAAVLAGAIVAASWFAFKRRSRRGIAVVMLLSLFYFGFYRLGCVCSIGAVQNAALSIGGDGYAVSFPIIAFLLLPLFGTLLFGRTFCGGVCPLGAIQDVVALKALKIPRPIEAGLSLFAVAYLAAAVLLAFSGTVFLICRFDPFVSIFRLVPVGKWIEQVAMGEAGRVSFSVAGRVDLLILGGVMLLVGVFVARPYCRYICPYSVLLRPLSRLSKWHVTITPDECVQCRLCENSCPYNAIEAPSAPDPGRHFGKLGLSVCLVLWPVMIAAGLCAGWLAGPAVSRTDHHVRLAEHLRRADAGEETDHDLAAAYDRQPLGADEIHAIAGRVRSRVRHGAMIVGGFVGLVAGMRLVRWSVRRRRPDYVPDRGTCLSCGRCFEVCPIERKRRNDAAASAGEDG